MLAPSPYFPMPTTPDLQTFLFGTPGAEFTDLYSGEVSCQAYQWAGVRIFMLREQVPADQGVMVAFQQSWYNVVGDKYSDAAGIIILPGYHLTDLDMNPDPKLVVEIPFQAASISVSVLLNSDNTLGGFSATWISPGDDDGNLPAAGTFVSAGAANNRTLAPPSSQTSINLVSNNIIFGFGSTYTADPSNPGNTAFASMTMYYGSMVAGCPDIAILNARYVIAQQVVGDNIVSVRSVSTAPPPPFPNFPYNPSGDVSCAAAQWGGIHLFAGAGAGQLPILAYQQFWYDATGARYRGCVIPCIDVGLGTLDTVVGTNLLMIPFGSTGVRITDVLDISGGLTIGLRVTWTKDNTVSTFNVLTRQATTTARTVALNMGPDEFIIGMTSVRTQSTGGAVNAFNIQIGKSAPCAQIPAITEYFTIPINGFNVGFPFIQPYLQIGNACGASVGCMCCNALQLAQIQVRITTDRLLCKISPNTARTNQRGLFGYLVGFQTWWYDLNGTMWEAPAVFVNGDYNMMNTRVSRSAEPDTNGYSGTLLIPFGATNVNMTIMIDRDSGLNQTPCLFRASAHQCYIAVMPAGFRVTYNDPFDGTTVTQYAVDETDPARYRDGVATHTLRPDETIVGISGVPTGWTATQRGNRCTLFVLDANESATRQFFCGLGFWVGRIPFNATYTNIGSNASVTVPAALKPVPNQGVSESFANCTLREQTGQLLFTTTTTTTATITDTVTQSWSFKVGVATTFNTSWKLGGVLSKGVEINWSWSLEWSKSTSTANSNAITQTKTFNVGVFELTVPACTFTSSGISVVEVNDPTTLTLTAPALVAYSWYNFSGGVYTGPARPTQIIISDVNPLNSFTVSYACNCINPVRCPITSPCFGPSGPALPCGVPCPSGP